MNQAWFAPAFFLMRKPRTCQAALRMPCWSAAWAPFASHLARPLSMTVLPSLFHVLQTSADKVE